MISDVTGGMLRYCSPFHGGWDIARMALRLPQSHVIFFCPASCARIIALNAIKNGIKDRLSVYGLTESEIVMNDESQAAMDSVKAVLDYRKERPRVIILFVSCIDSMLATDHEGDLKALRAAYPDIRFSLMRMNPICQSTQAQLPLFKLQQDVFDHLDARERTPRDEKRVALIGSNVPLPKTSDLRAHLELNGIEVLHIGECADFDAFQAMARPRMNIVAMPYGLDAAKRLKTRFGTDFVVLTQKLSPDAFDELLLTISARVGIPAPDVKTLRESAMEKLASVREKIGDMPVVLDSSAFMAPLSAARFLADAGFRVRAVYLNSAVPVEREEAQSLAASYPSLKIIDAGHYSMPGLRAGQESDILAIGLESACYAGAKYTNPKFCDDGRWGYDGLIALAEGMMQACESPRSARSIGGEATLCVE